MGAFRIGEFIPLKWEDFNSNNNTISVTKSLDSKGNLSSTKTKSSNATVTIPKSLTQELLKLKEDLCCTDKDYMFFAHNHTSRTTVRRIMKKHIELAGVPFIKIHGLRHSCASRMINMGISPLIVSKHLRHSSVKETLDTYSHIFPNQTVGIIDSVFED